MKGSSQIPLYLFAKAPVPGKVKTRMQPQLTENQSAELATQLILHSLEKVIDSWPGNCVLVVSPNSDHELFSQIKANHKIEIQVQIQGDLGQRMIHVLDQGVSEHGSAVVMGCDVPQITSEILIHCFNQLSPGKNVIGPAEDGGFYLLGLSEIDNALFDDVDWGGKGVMSQVLDNFRRLGFETDFCTELRDIDHWDDLKWLADIDPIYRQFLN